MSMFGDVTSGQASVASSNITTDTNTNISNTTDTNTNINSSNSSSINSSNSNNSDPQPTAPSTSTSSSSSSAPAPQDLPPELEIPHLTEERLQEQQLQEQQLLQQQQQQQQQAQLGRLSGAVPTPNSRSAPAASGVTDAAPARSSFDEAAPMLRRRAPVRASRSGASGPGDAAVAGGATATTTSATGVAAPSPSPRTPSSGETQSFRSADSSASTSASWNSERALLPLENLAAVDEDVEPKEASRKRGKGPPRPVLVDPLLPPALMRKRRKDASHWAHQWDASKAQREKAAEASLEESVVKASKLQTCDLWAQDSQRRQSLLLHRARISRENAIASFEVKQGLVAVEDDSREANASLAAIDDVLGLNKSQGDSLSESQSQSQSQSQSSTSHSSSNNNSNTTEGEGILERFEARRNQGEALPPNVPEADSELGAWDDAPGHLLTDEESKAKALLVATVGKECLEALEDRKRRQEEQLRQLVKRRRLQGCLPERSLNTRLQEDLERQEERARRYARDAAASAQQGQDEEREQALQDSYRELGVFKPTQLADLEVSRCLHEQQQARAAVEEIYREEREAEAAKRRAARMNSHIDDLFA